MALQNRIKELRARHNLTQDELAKRVDIRRETIVHLENNRYNPSLKLASDIARVFGVPIEEVLWYDEQK
ncbi:MAG: helix-turn-helix transcriptional regulator [Bacteroidetes bacterium]|nr:helix-turn-helix transcriptional regulator [Bacteroidota bacterium]